jgi:hypothetical protein
VEGSRTNICSVRRLKHDGSYNCRAAWKRENPAMPTRKLNQASAVLEDPVQTTDGCAPRASLPSPAFRRCERGCGERKIEWVQSAGMLHLASKFKRTKISACCPGIADGHNPTFGCRLIFAIHGPWFEVLDQGPALAPSV